jgi:hypothetical protein
VEGVDWKSKATLECSLECGSTLMMAIQPAHLMIQAVKSEGYVLLCHVYLYNKHSKWSFLIR